MVYSRTQKSTKGQLSWFFLWLAVVVVLWHRPEWTGAAGPDPAMPARPVKQDEFRGPTIDQVIDFMNQRGQVSPEDVLDYV